MLPNSLLTLQTETTEELDGLDGLTAAQQTRLVDVLDRYMIDVEEGRLVEVSELLAANADIAEPLEHYLHGLQLVRGLALSGGGSWDRRSTWSTSRDRSTGRQGRLERGLDRAPQSTTRLGVYELGPIIGRGAMGVVYRAQDTKLDRTVAVKVLAYAAAMESTRIDRFRREAKAAASLEHPNVVPVYAVGCESGTHYYAMQWIDGESLDRRIAAAKRLPSREMELATLPAELRAAAPLVGADRYRRLAEWGAAAAGALHAAHTAGIIHRDVKPSNLMLGSDGQVWVTDFGLARVQTEDGLTKTGDVVGTLRYMSPEQARGQGDLIDARSDVYGLGATLYELATLVPPHLGDDAVTLLQQLQTTEPVPPHQHDPQLPRDLETIICRAMRPRSADRYPSALAMAEDLQRFVDGKPIRAHAISMYERGLAWARQHRHLTAAIAAIGLLLMVSSFTTTLLVTRAQSHTVSALERAEQHYRQAREAVDTLGAHVAVRLGEVPQAESLRQEVLAETIHYYEKFIASSVHDDSLAGDVARTQLEIARLTSYSADYDQAQTAYAAAAAAFEQLASPPLAERSSDMAVLYCQTLNEWSLLSSRHGQHDQALQRLDRAIRFLKDGIGPSDQTDWQRHLALALSRNNRGVVLLHSQAMDDGKRELEQAIALMQAVPADALQTDNLRDELSSAFANLSALLSETEQYAEAATAAEHSLALRQRSQGNDAEHLMRLAVTHNNLAALHWKAQRADRAVSVYRYSVELLEQAIRSVPGRTEPTNRLAVTLNNLGMALVTTHDSQAAEKIFTRALSLAKPAVDADPADSEAANRLAGIQNNLAVLLRNQGRLREADALLEDAAERLQAVANNRPLDAGQQKTQQQVQNNLKNLRGGKLD